MNGPKSTFREIRPGPLTYTGESQDRAGVLITGVDGRRVDPFDPRPSRTARPRSVRSVGYRSRATATTPRPAAAGGAGRDPAVPVVGRWC
jgi:hypothetical protein